VWAGQMRFDRNEQDIRGNPRVRKEGRHVGADMGGISKLIREIGKIRQSAPFSHEYVYFRGQRSQDKLLPRLLRKSYEGIPTTENNLYCDCWVMGSQEFKSAHNSWEVLGVMQHHGVPTRLLDWTSSLIHAVYFALCECQDCPVKCHKHPHIRRREGCRGDPVVWLLAPRKMHQALASPPGLTAFTIGIDPLQDYAEVFVQTGTRKKWKYRDGPIFLELPWEDARMRSQKGYFTFHPDNRPLEKIRSKSLARIVMDRKWKGEILEEFSAMGINEYDVFADLVGLSRHLTRLYGL